MHKETVEQLATPEMRGQRLRALRKALQLSRIEFGKKLGIPPGTIQTWEDSRFGGLTEKGAKKISNAFTLQGIHCPLEWLFYGIGESPLRQLPSTDSNYSSYPLPNNSSTLSKPDIIQELQLFLTHCTDAVDTIIADDGMQPCLWPGDVVAGKRYFSDDIAQTVGLPCIVQLQNGQTLVRMLMRDDEENVYTLSCLNPDTRVKPSLLQKVKLFSAAPILWIRRATFPRSSSTATTTSNNGDIDPLTNE